MGKVCTFPLGERHEMMRIAEFLIVVLICPVVISADPVCMDGIVLKPDQNHTKVVIKNRVSDCRLVSGFLGTPVDGSVRSWTYRGWIAEYPGTSRIWIDPLVGVSYHFNGNDGLHISLSDNSGFNTVVLRGGAKTRMYIDAASLVEPLQESPFYHFTGNNDVEIMHVDNIINPETIDFFHTTEGRIADVGFYRVGEKYNGSSAGNDPVYILSPGFLNIPIPESVHAPESIFHAMNERYGHLDWSAKTLSLDNNSPQPISIRKEHALHCISEPFHEENGIESVTLDFTVSGIQNACTLTMVVQDPLDPRLDIFWMKYVCGDEGRYRVCLDFPDQVVFPGSQFWISIISDSDVTLSGPDGGSPRFILPTTNKEDVLSEALSYRLFLMKYYFQMLSETRPWGALRGKTKKEFFDGKRYEKLCPELFMTIDQCYKLAPENDTVRQYREWVYLRILDDLSTVSHPDEPPPGVPRWAWYVRQAWLETRRMAEWWVENRMVPTGEFGGQVSDDSDLYQQFTDLPFFENDGVGATLKQGGADLCELAYNEYLTGGLNNLNTDALHAYEEGINHLALMPTWFYGDPVYLERCMESASNITRITHVTEDGRRHFPDYRHIGIDNLANPPSPAIDGQSTPLLWHTALQVCEYNRNPELLKVIEEWADTWLQHMVPGKWATEIEVLSNMITGFNKDRPLYGGHASQACVFLWLYRLTVDSKYLEPFMTYYCEGKAPYPSDYFLSDVYVSGGLDGLNLSIVNTLGEWNPVLELFTTGRYGGIIDRMIGTPESSSSAITCLYDAIRWPDMYTSAEQYTDRLFPTILEYGSTSYLGGYTRRNKFNPCRAVSWEGFELNYAALVLDNRPDRLKVAVYNFADTELHGTMRIWNLDHGTYSVGRGIDTRGDFSIDKDRIETSREIMKADGVGVTLPPREVVIIELNMLERGDTIQNRADLAITARETIVKDTVIEGIVHNIGAQRIENTVIALIDSDGGIIQEVSVGPLEAPLDLKPKRKHFKIHLSGNPDKCWKLIADPGNRIKEIYEGNNIVEIGSISSKDHVGNMR